MKELLAELFAAYDALRCPPWENFDSKMKRLYKAIEELKAAHSRV